MENLINNTKLMNAVKINCKTENEVFTMTFRQAALKGEKFDAETSEIYETLTFNLSDLPAAVYQPCDAARHGIKQKLSDNLAGKRDERTLGQAIIDTKDLWEQLKVSWNATGKGTKAPTMKLSEMEAKFMAGVIAGVTTWEQANELYNMVTGKTLPPVPQNEESDENEDN